MNLQKSHYKKRDFFDEPEPEIIHIDKFGEELVEHKSSNLLNNMLPSQANLGKRERHESSEPHLASAETEQTKDQPLKRRKVEKSYTKFSKDEKEKAEVDEMLAKYLVTPKITFADLGGLDHVIKQL